MDNVLIVGHKGMLGNAWMSALSGATVFGIDKEDVDITDRIALRDYILAKRPSVIVNVAAINAVDNIESDEVIFELAKRVNAEAVVTLADVANEIDATLIHYSSDYIFDGKKGTSYEESDMPHPLSRYGELKVQSEGFAKKANKSYIIRLSRLFGDAGGEGSKPSFPEIMMKKMKAGEAELKGVDDEFASITYAPDLVSFSKTLVDEQYPYGIYHGANEGGASWYEWLQEVARLVGYDGQIHPVSRTTFIRPALRPEFSVLLNTIGPKTRPWQEALAEFLL